MLLHKTQHGVDNQQRTHHSEIREFPEHRQQRSTAKASNAAFGGTEQGSRRRTKGGSKQRNSDLKVSKT
jgi:hypothetical protein